MIQPDHVTLLDLIQMGKYAKTEYRSFKNGVQSEDCLHDKYSLCNQILKRCKESKRLMCLHFHSA